MKPVEGIFLLLMVAAGCVKAYAVLRPVHPDTGPHNWAWGLFWLAVVILVFGGRVLGGG